MMRWRVLLASLCLAGMVGVVIPKTSHGTPQIGALTFGAVLQLGLSKVSDLIREAQEAGRVVAITAAVQAQSVLVSAQVAYEASLKKTFDELNESERKAFTDMQSLVADLTAGTDEALAKASKDARLIANTLPFHGRHPQLVSYAPLYAQPDAEVYRVRFEGNFPFAFDARALPTLVLSTKSHEALLYDNLGLAFDVPARDLGDLSDDRIVRKPVTVEIPWNASRWYQVGPLRRLARARYAFELARLPRGAGKLTLITTEPYSEIETQRRESEWWTLDSGQDDKEETHCLDLSEADQRAGWRIVRTGVGRDVHVIEGEQNSDWYDRGQQETSDTKACWRMRTEHHAWDDDGKIRFRVHVEVRREVDRTRPKSHTDVLTWATSRSYSLPPGEWKIRIQLFDGREYELSRSELTNELVKVRATARDVTVSTFGAPGH